MAHSGRVPRARPFDVWWCSACESTYRFNEWNQLPNNAFDRCLSRCRWMLVEREGETVDRPPANADDAP